MTKETDDLAHQLVDSFSDQYVQIKHTHGYEVADQYYRDLMYLLMIRRGSMIGSELQPEIAALFQQAKMSLQAANYWSSDIELQTTLKS